MRQNRGVPGRRLILLLVMLLVTLSVLSAGRDISRRGPAGQTTTTGTTTGTTTAPEGDGSKPKKPETRDTGQKPQDSPAAGAVERRLPSADPIRVKIGDRVVLRVRTAEPDIISVDELGIRAPTGPGTPGALDFVAGSAGTYPVTLAIGDRRIGELSVRD